MKTKWIIGAVLIVAANVSGAEFELPLVLRPHNGKDGMKCISNGVPLEAGALMNVSGLRVLGIAPKGVDHRRTGRLTCGGTRCFG